MSAPEQPYSCEHFVALEQEPRHHLIVDNEFVRGFAVEIAPHDRTLCHQHHHDYVLYIAGDAEVLSAPRDSEPQTFRYSDEECDFSAAGLVHVVENLSVTKFRNVVVELLPGVASLRRGQDPTAIIGEVIVDQRFTEELASVFLLNMESGSEVEVCGPAILASPYEHKVELTKPSGEIYIFNGFIDLAWIPPSDKGRMKNLENAPARVVVIVVGPQN